MRCFLLQVRHSNPLEAHVWALGDLWTSCNGMAGYELLDKLDDFVFSKARVYLGRVSKSCLSAGWWLASGGNAFHRNGWGFSTQTQLGQRLDSDLGAFWSWTWIDHQASACVPSMKTAWVVPYLFEFHWLWPLIYYFLVSSAMHLKRFERHILSRIFLVFSWKVVQTIQFIVSCQKWRAPYTVFNLCWFP